MVAIRTYSEPQGLLDVKSFGAVGDGVTDDTAAVQRTIDAAATNGGGIVWFPAGTYLLDSTSTDGYGHTYNLYIVSDNITLEGAPGSSIVTDSNASFLYVSGSGKPGGVEETGTHVITNTTYTTTYSLSGAVAKGDTSVTTATASHAGNFSAGDWVLVRTGQTLDGSVLQPDAEINMVQDSNATSGVITLRWPTAKPYQQEYFVSGTSGISSTSVTANAAVYGIAKITDRVLHNISLVNLTLTCSGLTSAYALTGDSVQGLRITDCRYTGSGGFQSMGATRDVVVENNTIIVTGTGTWKWALATDTCTSDVVWRNNTILGSGRVVFLHIHEGSSRVKVIGNSIVTIVSSANENTVSIRARAYDIVVRDNIIVGGGLYTSVYVDPYCTGGGLIAYNTIVSDVDPIACYATGWRISENSSGATISATVAFDSATERLACVVKDDSGGTVEMGVLPAYSYVKSAHIHVLEAFNSSGSDVISVGYSGSAQAYATNTDVSTTGIKTVTLGASAGYVGSSDGSTSNPTSVVATYTNGGTAPTTGKAMVVLEYSRVPRVT